MIQPPFPQQPVPPPQDRSTIYTIVVIVALTISAVFGAIFTGFPVLAGPVIAFAGIMSPLIILQVNGTGKVTGAINELHLSINSRFDAYIATIEARIRAEGAEIAAKAVAAALVQGRQEGHDEATTAAQNVAAALVQGQQQVAPGPKDHIMP